MPAIRAAIRLGVDLVEIDVQETRDGQLVVFHDYRLDRVYGVHKRVRDAQRHELPGAPTLADVLRLRFPLLIEIKGANGAKVARAIARHRMERRVIVFSNRPRRLAELAAANPRIRRFGLTGRLDARRLPASPGPVAGWGVSRRLARTQAVVQRFWRRGWPVFVWTVNREAEMRRLAAWGVAGLITNHPDRATFVLARVADEPVLIAAKKS